MTNGHISPQTLGNYTRRALSSDELEQFDRHLAGCEPCRDTFLALTPDGSGLLNAIAFEQRRHLTYEQLETALEQPTPDHLDELARQHFSDCEICQRELADLQAFDAVLSKTAPAQQVSAAAARPPSLWGMLFWPVTGLAGAIAVAVVVFVTTGIIPIGTRAVRMEVTLESSNPDESGERVRLLTGSSTGPALSADLARRLEDASRRAASTGEPQTIRLMMSDSQYQILSKVNSAMGGVESEPAGTLGSARRRVEVSMMIQPPPSRQ